MRPQRILVVDDSSDIREMWCLWLEANGFAVLEAIDGADALRQMEGEPPDLVLLDVMMPVMDGLETLKRLRAQENTSTMPVIVVSARGEMTARMAHQLGSDAYVSKPVNPDDLLSHIRSLLGADVGCCP